jgi:hypothetical protein
VGGASDASVHGNFKGWGQLPGVPVQPRSEARSKQVDTL